MDNQVLIDISCFHGAFFHNYTLYYSNLNRNGLLKYVNIYLDLKEDIKNEKEYSLNEKGMKIFKKYFLIDPFKLLDTVYEINNSNYTKNIESILKSRFEKDFYKLDEYYVDWFNIQNTFFLKRMLSNKKISLYNKMNEILYFFPDRAPEKIIIYRGIKSEYVKERNREFTSWTLNKEEAVRFATYRFNRFKPTYAKVSIVLELEIKLSDIDLFIIGDEDEVVIKNVNERFGDDIKSEKIKITSTD
jgi:hypothetical protein